MLCPKGQEVFIRNKSDPVVFSKIVVGVCNFFVVVIFLILPDFSGKFSYEYEFNFPPLSSGGSQIS